MACTAWRRAGGLKAALKHLPGHYEKTQLPRGTWWENKKRNQVKQGGANWIHRGRNFSMKICCGRSVLWGSQGLTGQVPRQPCLSSMLALLWAGDCGGDFSSPFGAKQQSIIEIHSKLFDWTDWDLRERHKLKEGFLGRSSFLRGRGATAEDYL